MIIYIAYLAASDNVAYPCRILTADFTIVIAIVV